MSVIIGNINKNGSSSAANLTEDNGMLVDGNFMADNMTIYHTGSELEGSYSSLYVSSDVWNVGKYKEVKIDGSYQDITVDNMTDVSITNQSELGYSDISILSAKRGDINTSGIDSDDSIFIGVESNSANWSNLFTIKTGYGDDTVTMTNFGGSKWTEFDINTGKGSDVVDISDLDVAVSDSQVRHVDGGTGFDVLYTNGDDNLEIEGFEVIIGLNSESITVDQDLVENNGSGQGLVLTGVDIEFSSDLEYTVQDLELSQMGYLNDLKYDYHDFSQVIVTIDGEDYVLLVDDSDFAVA